MSDPERLLDGGDLAGVLLRAGRDVDAERARARRIALLGGAGGVAAAAAASGAPGAGAAGKGLLGALLLKWMALGAIAGVVLTGGYAVATSDGGAGAPAALDAPAGGAAAPGGARGLPAPAQSAAVSRAP
ncbi:MAG: hypothetical protein IT372_17700, partial [Polyangiaceae bacterium]|nr:hypothetical protein [Polyangiaceae bacterium]